MKESAVNQTRNAVIGVLIVLSVLFVLMLLGMGYPVVGRNDSVPGVPNSLMLWAALLASMFSVATVVLTMSHQEKVRKLLSPLFGYFCFGLILITGSLFFFNGVFDRSRPQVFKTTAVSKYIHQMRGTDYFVLVRDWKNPAQNVRLWVDPQTYGQIDPAQQRPISITTARGFLGFERIVSVQQSSLAHVLLLG